LPGLVFLGHPFNRIPTLRLVAQPRSGFLGRYSENVVICVYMFCLIYGHRLPGCLSTYLPLRRNLVTPTKDFLKTSDYPL